MSTAPTGFTRLQNHLLIDATLDVHCRLLAACLLMHAMQKDDCHPSQATLAAYLCCDERTVQRHLKHLEAKAGLRIQREASKGKWRNVYHVGALKRERPNTTPASGSQVSEETANTTPVSGPNTTPVSPSEHDIRVVRRIRTFKKTKMEEDTAFSLESSNHDRHPRTHAPRESLAIAPPGADWLWAYNHLSNVAFETPDDDVMRSWLQTYGDQRFIRAVELLTIRKSDPKAKAIDAPLQWIEAAMKGDFKPNARDMRFATARACTTA